MDTDSKYHDLLEFAPDAFFLGDANGGFILANGKASQLTGYQREELLGMKMRELFAAEDLDQKPLRFDLLKQGQSILTEREIIRKDGKRVPVEMHSKQNADGTYQSFMRDISERIRQKRAFDEIHQRYSLAFHTSPDALTITTLDGIYVDVNLGFCRATGYERDEIIGKSAIELGIWVDPEARKTLVETIKRDGVIYNLDAAFRRKDGSITIALMSANIIRINDIPHLISISKEITERRAIEEELRIAKERAEESDRLKSAFLANLSHEIRTPMNGIIGFCDLLRNGDLCPETEAQYFDIIHASSRHLLALINDIVEVSRIETNQIQPNIERVDAGLILAELEQQLAAPTTQAAPPAAQLLIQKDPEILRTDPLKLKQILINLIANAQKFTPSGSIEVSYQRTAPNELRFEVRDTGIGIVPKYHSIIFERFRQVPEHAHSPRRGSGLGLSICKAYVELLGGRIQLHSTPGKGSTFSFTIKDFPARTERESLAKPAPFAPSIPDAATRRSSHAKRILIVEDDDVNYLLISRLLDSWGYRHLRATNGRDAVTLATDESVDLVLMDLQLPLQSGLDATRQILGLRSQVPIIAQTAHALSEEQSALSQQGFQAYITKPIDHFQLRSAIESLI